MKNKIIVWYNPHKDSYYYRYVTGIYRDYQIGYTDSYDHVVILIIDDEKIFEPTVIKYRVSLFYWLLTFIIFIFKKLIRFLTYIKDLYERR